jgi:upstream activation factor subunit UAF30
MAKKTSTKTSVDSTVTASTSSAPVVAPVVASTDSVPSVAPVKEKKVKVAKTCTQKVEASVPAAVTNEVVVPVTSENENVEIDELLNDQSIEFVAKLQQLGTLLSGLKTEFRALEKKWSRELKTAQKQSSKRKRKSGNRAPSGFVKPTRISDELSSFLAKPVGSEMARTEVTREINKYIRTHNLQDKTNGRKIIPDAKLATLLKLKKTDELTYFNLQKYMSPHFAKATKDAVAPAPATV